MDTEPADVGNATEALVGVGGSLEKVDAGEVLPLKRDVMELARESVLGGGVVAVALALAMGEGKDSKVLDRSMSGADAVGDWGAWLWLWRSPVSWARSAGMDEADEAAAEAAG